MITKEEKSVYKYTEKGVLADYACNNGADRKSVV